MGTSSAIGMKMDDGTIRAVRCNWDGYLQGVGRVLGESYSDLAKVKQLLALGFLSSLDEKVAPEPGTAHSWQHPQPGVTLAYHRDRKERLQPAERFADQDDYELNGEGRLEANYLYLYECSDGQGCWAVLTDEGWKDVVDLLAAEDER